MAGSGATRRATACRAMLLTDPFTKATTVDVWVEDRGSLYRIRNGKAELFALPGAPFSGLRSFSWTTKAPSGLGRLRLDCTDFRTHPSPSMRNATECL